MRSPFLAFSVVESSRPMMRSESRTDETSGLVTITAESAYRMASCAPRSMPAGLSQITQSNLLRSSTMTLCTPSSVSASLSRVCEAGKSQRVSNRLSRISACESLAMPCTTLTRSKTTRRSAPITRSRLRRPTSKPMTTTFSPACANAAPSAAVDVVLPTPPLPDVTTKTLAMYRLLRRSVQRCNDDGVVVEPNLHRPATQLFIDLVGAAVVAVDREQFGLEPLAENTGALVSPGACDSATAQSSVDVNRTACDDLSAGRDRTEHRQVAFREADRLAGAHGTVEHQ